HPRTHPLHPFPTRRSSDLPTGQYARRAWFLFEWLMEQRLDLDDLKSVPYVPLVDPERFFTGLPNRSSRHAIDENFLGTRQFSPRSEEHTSELQSRGHLVCR